MVISQIIDALSLGSPDRRTVNETHWLTFLTLSAILLRFVFFFSYCLHPSLFLSLLLYHVKVAGRALGDVVRKLGDRVLPEMIPVLNDGLSLSHPPEMRQGVCLGLAEVLACATKKQLEDYLDIVVWLCLRSRLI